MSRPVGFEHTSWNQAPFKIILSQARFEPQAHHPPAPVLKSRPTICTAMTLMIVIDGKIIA